MSKLVAGPPVSHPFYKRTEFYLSVAALVFGALLASGVLADGSPWTKLVGMAVEALAVLGYTTGRTFAKRDAADRTGRSAESMRRGYRTSEFWKTVAAAALMSTQAYDVLPSDHPVAGLIAVLLTALPPVAYTAGRGLVKGATLVPALLALLLPGVVGCGGFSAATVKALEGAHDMLKVTYDRGEPLFTAACSPRAVSCRDARRAAEARQCADDACRTARAEAIKTAKDCARLTACHALYAKFKSGIIASHLLVADVVVAIQLGDAAAAKDIPTLLRRVREAVARSAETITALRSLQ